VAEFMTQTEQNGKIKSAENLEIIENVKLSKNSFKFSYSKSENQQTGNY
jgi:hypothetical protein